MPIVEPRIRAACDRCDDESEDMDLTMLAGGGWDDRNIKKRLLRDGWQINGDETICPECVALTAADRGGAT